MAPSAGLLLAAGAVGFLQAGGSGSTACGACSGPLVPSDPLVPDSVVALPGGPTLVLERAPGLPVVGVRISAPVEPGSFSAARALIDGALNRTRSQASAIGAALRGGIEDGRIAYQVVGDRRDMDELAWIVRRLASSPSDEPDGGVLRREEARLDRLAETPQGRLTLELTRPRSPWDAPGDAPRDAQRTLPVVGAEEVRELWRRSHARDRLRVFVLGDVPVPRILADLSRVGAPPLDMLGVDAAGSGVPGSGVPESGVSGSGVLGSAEPSFRSASPPSTPLYAWSAAAFTLGPVRDPVALAATEALRAALGGLDAPGAAVWVHQVGEGAGGWIGLAARASRRADADAAVAAALELATVTGLSPWWQRGVDEARRKIATAAAVPEEWLALADRYFSPDSRDASAWPRGALNRLDALTEDDLVVALDRLRRSLFRPRIDT